MALRASDRNCLNCARSESDDADLFCRKPVEDRDDIAYPETVVTIGVDFAQSFKCRDWISAEKEQGAAIAI